MGFAIIILTLPSTNFCLDQSLVDNYHHTIFIETLSTSTLAKGKKIFVLCFFFHFYIESFLKFLFCTTSCKVVVSSPCAQWNRWIFVGSKGWIQMQCDNPRTKGWEKPNLMHNAMKKPFENRWKKRMIGQANNQMLTSSPAHDLRHVQCESKNK